MELAPAFVLVYQVSRLYLSSAVTLILLQVWNAFTMNYFLSFVFFCFIVMFDILVLMILIVLIFNVVISVTRVENSHSIPAFCEIKITLSHRINLFANFSTSIILPILDTSI